MKKIMKAEDAAALDKKEFAQWVSDAPTEELERVYEKVSFRTNQARWMLVDRELNKRRFVASRRPHWTVVPTFWLVVVSVTLSTAAVGVTVVLNWDKIKMWIDSL